MRGRRWGGGRGESGAEQDDWEVMNWPWLGDGWVRRERSVPPRLSADGTDGESSDSGR